MWEQLENFHFIRPMWLLAMVPLAVVVWVYAQRRLKAGSWSRVCDERLLPFILIGQQQAASPWRLLALAVCGLLLILALAGPAWNKLPQPVFRSQAALVIALDLSRSMDVKDIKPSRLTRARHKILDILDRRKEGQTALIVYAAEPFVVTPLTEDTKTVATLVKDLTTDLMPYQGSYPEKALKTAIDLFRQASIVNGHVLLVTDSIDSSNIGSTVKELTGAGYSLSVLGIGTEQGAPIADRSGGFVKDSDGSIVLARLDEQQLKNVAREGNGIYRKITASDSDINSLLQVISPSRLGEDFSANDETLKLESDQWREEGPWLLLLLLPFVALTFRRGYLAVIIIVLLPLPQESYAFEWSSLWVNQNQQAAKALEQGDSQSAAEMFTDPEWKGAANYRAGDYQKAIETLDGIDKPDALYNRGNAFAKAGDLQQAINAYDEVLKINPGHEDAKYNRDLLQKYLEQQQQQQQDGDQSQNDENSQNNNQNNNDQQSDSQNSNQNDASQENNQSSQDQQSQNQQADSSDSEGEQQNQQQSSQQDDQQSEQQQRGDSEQPQSDEEQQALAEQQQQAQQQQSDEENQSDDSATRMAQSNNELEEDPETMHKTEQWLRRIPDDPGGLLRRKFRYQSQMDRRQAQGETKPW
jgi:Ca-activated chloride channel family protein